MKWKCKECGYEIVAELEFNNSLYFTLNKNKNLDEIDSLCELEDIIKSDGNIVGYCCGSCGARNENLEEIAIWED